MARPYNEARQAANKRYDDKTYKRLIFRMRIEDDADIIEAFEQAQASGITAREWLRSLIEKQEEF